MFNCTEVVGDLQGGALVRGAFLQICRCGAQRMRCFTRGVRAFMDKAPPEASSQRKRVPRKKGHQTTRYSPQLTTDYTRLVVRVWYANVEKWIFVAPPSRERGRDGRRQAYPGTPGYLASAGICLPSSISSPWQSAGICLPSSISSPYVYPGTPYGEEMEDGKHIPALLATRVGHARRTWPRPTPPARTVRWRASSPPRSRAPAWRSTSSPWHVGHQD